MQVYTVQSEGTKYLCTEIHINKHQSKHKGEYTLPTYTIW